MVPEGRFGRHVRERMPGGGAGRGIPGRAGAGGTAEWFFSREIGQGASLAGFADLKGKRVGIGVPLHPGAEHFYKEAGLL